MNMTESRGSSLIRATRCMLSFSSGQEIPKRKNSVSRSRVDNFLRPFGVAELPYRRRRRDGRKGRPSSVALPAACRVEQPSHRQLTAEDELPLLAVAMEIVRLDRPKSIALHRAVERIDARRWAKVLNEGRPPEVALVRREFAAPRCAVFVAAAQAHKEADSLLVVARAIVMPKAAQGVLARLLLSDRCHSHRERGSQNARACNACCTWSWRCAALCQCSHLDLDQGPRQAPLGCKRLPS